MVGQGKAGNGRKQGGSWREKENPVNKKSGRPSLPRDYRTPAEPAGKISVPVSV